MKKEKQSFLSIFIKGIACSVILLAIGLLILDLSSGNLRGMKGIHKKMGSLAEYGAIAAGSLWLMRHIWLYINKHKKEVTQYAKGLFLLLKKYHTWIGYAVFSLAITHSVYFLLVGSRNILQWYSGIAAIIGLVFVVIAGILLQNLKNKKKYGTYRKIHQLVAILFGVGLIIHLIV